MPARIRYAIRSLWKAPLLSLVVVLSLGLGIGANTAIFSLLHQVILSSLAVPHPEQLVLLTAPADTKGGRNSTGNSGDMQFIFSYPMFRELEKRPEGLTGLAAFRETGANLAYRNQTVSDDVLMVSGGYFPVLGVQPLLGRVIGREDDRNGGNPVAILGYGYWHDRLGASEEALNKPITINGNLFTIVGVAPRNFTSTTLGEEPAAYVPLSFQPMMEPTHEGTKRWNDFYLYLFGRLKPGVSMTRAQAGLNSVFAGLVAEWVQSVPPHQGSSTERILKSRLTLEEGRHGSSSVRDEARTPVLILLAATVLVLLIAVANAANLLLARSAERRRELAIRAAMGAGRGEIMGQFLTEALLLAVSGGLIGLLFATITLKLLLHQITATSEAPRYFLTARLEWPVLLFSLGVSLVAGLVFGLYPAWEAARATVAGTLKDEAGQSSGTKGTAAVRRALVCAQVAVAAVLLIPTGLLLKSMVNLFHVDLGIRTTNVLQFTIEPELNGYKPPQSQALFERVESEMAVVPGAKSVAAAQIPLLAGSHWGSDVHVKGFTQYAHSWYNEIGPGYFAKLGIPLLAGREFSESDNLAGPKVAVVNEEFVRRYLAGQNAIGQQFTGNAVPLEIVGVVKDSHYGGVKEKPYPVFYTPWRQDKHLGALMFYVRTALPAEKMIPQIRMLLARFDRSLPAESLRTLDEQVAQSISRERILVQLAAAFAALATALAMLGLYGVMAHSVARRTREIGIRMAVGATPWLIRGMVMREMLWIAGVGLALGVPAALALAKYPESQLYGVNPHDAMVAAGAALALAATAAAAAYIPARRASKVSPMRALRYE